MRVGLGLRLVVSLCFTPALSGCIPGSSPTGTVPVGGAHESVVILAVNDIYRIEGLEGGAVGGLARLRTLRAELERAHPGRVLLLHGGDVIFPSFLSRMYRGSQMIDVLNLLDGDPQAGQLDERMFVALGNHEFEREACRREPVLQRRVDESDFYWLRTNVTVACVDGHLRLSGPSVLFDRIVTVGGLRVGLLGLTIDTRSDVFRFWDPRETARAAVRELRQRGADVVVAVTHLNWRDDEALFEEVRRDGLDVIIGGHDHTAMTRPEGAPEPRIFKADADARTAWVVRLTRDPTGRVAVTGDLRPLGSAVAKDPAVDQRVAQWLRRHAEEFCKQAAAPGSGWLGVRPVTGRCLEEELAVAETPLDASEEKIRSQETSLGNWITDQIVTAFRDCRVDGAFVNAGGLRLNQDLATGTVITMRHLEELVQYSSALQVYSLSHAQLRHAFANAISEPGAGRWLQISNQLAFTYQPGDARTAPRLLNVVWRPSGRPPVDVTDASTGTLRIVANEFLQKDPTDGFDKILPPPDGAPCPAAGIDLKKVLYDAFKAQRRIASGEPGRICTADQTRQRPCRAVLP